VYRMDDLLLGSLSSLNLSNVAILLKDYTNPETPLHLAHYHNNHTGLDDISDKTSYMDVQYPFQRKVNLPFGQKDWTLEINATKEYIVEVSSQIPYWVLTGGLLFSTLVGLFLHIMTGRNYLDRQRVNEINQRIIAESALARANEVKDEFLASMSHELRTPLTAIIGNSEFLSEQIVVPNLREVVTDIEAAGRVQLALVNDILDMSKIDSGKFTINESPYDLARVLGSVERMVAIRVHDGGLKFVIDQKNQEKYQLLGDSQRIAQILINLLGNAVKFTEQGQITLTTWVEAQQIYFQVKDTGIGMSPQEQSHLFKRFEQADSSISKRFGGSGLGLYISMNLAHLMGGEMSASSQLGQGSIFTLSLPYRVSDLLVKEGETNASKSIGAVEQFSGHVLIAEDTPAIQLLEKRILENMGLMVTAVADGEEAVKEAMAQSFDLILMDMQMPVMDGIEATKRLKEQGNQTPVVALTANVMDKHRDLFEQAGCSGFMAKPIDKDELRGMLREYLSTSEDTVGEELNIIEWDESCSVGNQLLDEQHQQISNGINELVSYCHGKKTQASHVRALKLLSKLERILSAHLKDEEVLLKEVGYPELKLHIQGHRYYTDSLSRLFQQDMNSQTIVDMTSLMLVWWRNHILKDDMKFKPYFKQHGELGLPVGYKPYRYPFLRSISFIASTPCTKSRHRCSPIQMVCGPG